MLKNEAIYSIYASGEAQDLAENLEVVSDKFSLLAFFFNFFWLLFNRLWPAAVVVFLLLGAIVALYKTGHISLMEMSLMRFGIALFLGFEAGSLKTQKLEHSGYLLLDVIYARSALEAQSRYLERMGTGAQPAVFTAPEPVINPQKPRRFRTFSRT